MGTQVHTHTPKDTDPPNKATGSVLHTPTYTSKHTMGPHIDVSGRSHTHSQNPLGTSKQHLQSKMQEIVGLFTPKLKVDTDMASSLLSSTTPPCKQS